MISPHPQSYLIGAFPRIWSFPESTRVLFVAITVENDLTLNLEGRGRYRGAFLGETASSHKVDSFLTASKPGLLQQQWALSMPDRF